MADSDPAPVNRRWQGWVAENILLYSEMLRLLLPRFFRMNLTASKNVVQVSWLVALVNMSYQCLVCRIAKVFIQPG